MAKRNITFLFIILLIFTSIEYGKDEGRSAENIVISTAFSPDKSALNLVISCIDGAKKSICIAAYSFTSRPIAIALLNAHKRGIKVRLIADEKSSKGRYSAVTFLANQGVPVRVNGRYAILHHKFMIIDETHIQTGSFNYSAAAATRNAENVLLLRNVTAIANDYMQEWLKLWKEGKDILPNY